MKARGRPPHPDILTPRQWEVLECVRQGLTNEEIAQRLGITLDGAKFHVSEILLRLGVESRYEAANWRPQAARSRWAFALAPFALLHKVKWGFGYAAAGVIAAAVAVGVALLAWGVTRSGGGTPPPVGAAIGAANPEQIIYTTLKPGEVPGTHQRWDVNVYDTSASRITHTFEIGDGVNDQPTQVVAAGDTLVADLTDRIVRYDLDGSNAQEFRRGADGGRILGIAASPDGMKIALAEQTGPQCPTSVPGAEATPELCSDYAPITRVAVISNVNGAQLMSVPQTAPGFAGYRGQAALPTWRADDSGFVVASYTYSEEAGSTATVMLDGSVRTFDASGYAMLSPNALYAASGPVSFSCGLGGIAEQHQIVIQNVEDGSMVARVSDPILNVTPEEWSPDGSELLYHSAPVVDDPSASGCKQEDTFQTRWYLLPVDGSPPSTIGGVLAARGAWYGTRALEFRCGGVLVFQSRVDPSCLDTNGVQQPIDASIHGRPSAPECNGIPCSSSPLAKTGSSECLRSPKADQRAPGPPPLLAHGN